MAAGAVFQFTGWSVRYVEHDVLTQRLASDAFRPGRAFLQFHDAGQHAAAVRELGHTGQLSVLATSALADAVLQVGVPAGFVDTESSDAPAASPQALKAEVARLVSQVLALEPTGPDAALAERLVDGGMLDRVPAGPQAVGSLPVRTVATRLVPVRLTVARAQLTSGWAAELLNVLESTGLRMVNHAEDWLALVPQWRRG